MATLVVGAGMIGGTGAFSSVSADRSVNVQTAADSDANVQFVINADDHASLSDDGGDTIAFDFDKVNLNANTTYDNVLKVTINSGQSGNYDIEVTEEPEGVDVSFDGTDTVSTTAGTTEQADITIDTSGDTSAESDEIDETIEFTVTATS